MIRCLRFPDGKEIRVEIATDLYTRGDGRRVNLSTNIPGTPEMQERNISLTLTREEASQLAGWLTEP